MISQPSHTRILIFWFIIAGLFFWFLSAIQAILLPFVVGMLVAYFLDPAADKLEKWGLSRTLATTIITFSFFSFLIGAMYILTPIAYKQASGLIKVMPNYISHWQEHFQPQINQVIELVDNVKDESGAEAKSKFSSVVLKKIATLSKSALESSFALINIISLIVIMPVVSFYLLRDWDRFIARVDSLLPRTYADTIREQAKKIDQTISGFVRGTLNVMFILGVFYAIALSVAGLKFALLIGALGGFMIIIPYLGTILSGAVAVGMAWLQFDDIQSIGIVFAIFVIGQMLEGYVLTPRLVGDKVGLHPLWLIFGMLAGAALFGFVGVFLAVPLTAIIGVLVRFAIEGYKKSDYYQGVDNKA